MIDKQYCYRLLFEQKKQGIDCQNFINKLALSPTVPRDVLQYLNSTTKPAITEFFEDLKERNKKRTNKLYGTLLKETEDIEKLAKALSSYITQVIIFTEGRKNTERKQIFEQLRVEEVLNALNSYFTKEEVSPILNVSKSISTDIKIIECRA